MCERYYFCLLVFFSLHKGICVSLVLRLSSSGPCFFPQVWLLRPRDARGGALDVLQSFRMFNGRADLSGRIRRGDGLYQHQRHHGHPHAAERRSGGWKLKHWGNWLGSHGLHTLPFVLLHQVVLLTSSEDPVTQSLADKLAQRTGCQVIQVGEELLCDLYPMVEQRKLQWNDVAYMGKADNSYCFIYQTKVQNIRSFFPERICFIYFVSYLFFRTQTKDRKARERYT